MIGNASYTPNIMQIVRPAHDDPETWKLTDIDFTV